MFMAVRTMADEHVTIGDELPENFLERLEDAAGGYKGKDLLDWPEARSVPAGRIQELTEEWEPEAASRMHLYTDELERLLEEVAEEPAEAKAFVDEEIGGD